MDMRRATQPALFSLVVGIALLAVGIGFIVLALGGALPGAARSKAPQPEGALATTS
jgi:hypothetical protein